MFDIIEVFNITPEVFSNTYKSNVIQIPLFNLHQCSTTCNQECMNNNKFMKQTFNIFRYRPYDENYLFDPDIIVIPDRTFKICVRFPLTYYTRVTIDSNNDRGCTLGELLWIIRKVYIAIYKREEESANSHTHYIDEKCRHCHDDSIGGYLERIKATNDETSTTITSEICSICHSDLEGEHVLTECSHVFHGECLNVWLKRKRTCPLCRQDLMECKECNNTGIVQVAHQWKVIPREYRRKLFFNFRNNTDGVYGIHSYDIDQLYLHNLSYCPEQKMLELGVQGIVI